MTDRVHPSPADAVHIQMPEKSIRKEQEETLIAKRKDFVYGAPPALPPDHPGLLAARRRGEKRRKRGRCCCCMISFFATLAVLAVAIGITVGVLWLVLKPKAPEFRVKSAEVRSITMAVAASDVKLNASIRLEVEAENPNKKIGIYYDEVGLGVKYEGEEIGKGAIAGFYQGHRNVTTITVEILGTDVSLTQAMAASLNTSMTTGSLPLDSAARASVRIRIGSWKSKSARVAVDCHLLLAGLPLSSASVSSSCNFKLKSIDIF